MPSADPAPDLFPELSREAILAFQFSAWYPRFRASSVKSTIIRPLSAAFVEYLNADGVVVPEGAEDLPATSTLDDGDDDGDDDSADARQRYAFPELDAKIRASVSEYGAVFPKLNFSSPRDAAWILPPGSPMKCSSPAEVYMLLKSSDFIAHDLDAAAVFDGCHPGPDDDTHEYQLELVLRKWYPMDRSREFRCFVRRGMLLGISQRDENYYEFLNKDDTRAQISATITSFWESKIKPVWAAPRDYTFDVLLTRALDSAHILDFNPYAPRTDALLFTYPDLLALLLVRLSRSTSVPAPGSGSGPGPGVAPELRTIGSRAHPAAARPAPAHAHNMLPREALELASGRGVAEFARAWAGEVARAAVDSGDDDDDDDG